MSVRTYNACHRAVSRHHGSPPNSFLNQLIDAINPLPDEVFAKNDRNDIYSVMERSLGPWTGLLHRKAVMCEVLRVEAAFESDWNWNEGVDINNEHSRTHIDGQETGAFQVSADSMVFDKSLVECVERHAGGHDPITFISSMKQNHPLAVEYCARLLRFNTRWCGTINDHTQVVAHVRSEAVTEFQSFLQSSPAPIAAMATPIAAMATPSAAMATPSAAMATPIAAIATPSAATATPSAASATPSAASAPASPAAGTKVDKDCIEKLIQLGSSGVTLESAQQRAAEDLLACDGEEYPYDGCAITLSILLRDAGIDLALKYQAIALGEYLRDMRKWEVIPVGEQQAGDVGCTCGTKPNHGEDHIYLVLKRLNGDEMLIGDNQSTHAHFRYASGQDGKAPTNFFLRARGT